MQKKIETKREKYYSTSIRLPKALYEQLENSDLDFLNPEKVESKLNNKIQYKILQNRKLHRGFCYFK